MVFDFAAMPPEINSALMYTGPGSGPMMAAAAAWNSTAADLSTTAAGAQSVITELAGGEWLGPSSLAMASAVQPYIEWMETTAGELAQAASQAMASAAAYEAAFAMTVPPPAIAANRTQLAALVATNFLGLNTPAILATEALYAEMWAQDAAAMYGYSASSASAAVLSPLTEPPQTTNLAGQGAQSAAVAGGAANNAQSAGLNSLVGSAPNAMQAMATPLAAAAADNPIDDFLSNSLISNLTNGGFNVAAWQMFAAIPSAVLYAKTVGDATAGAAAAGGVAAGLSSTAVPAVAAAPIAGLASTPVLAGMASSSTVGGLSVPAGWSAATPEAGNSLLAGSGWTAPTEEGMGTTNVAAGMPAVASAGRGGYGFSTPRYGIKPTVMPKSVLV
ncbi:PPE family protein [Candidatus Mycobacterium wuenschmannii]|uniref:PPE family protein n=1 Tax=Candidatus Mycobacterium wuenschmannii TaxID=3027808 RepID=A0ABY8W221_9MYCO|nr:PPE family protein [Candidatus Mycobacterium wuenschmannii]WIM89914.1 PPE family protein [Candidatus Mycobacterium wuenschmannii]